MANELKMKQREQMELLLNYIDQKMKENVLKDLQIRQLKASRENLLCQINQLKREMIDLTVLVEKMSA